MAMIQILHHSQEDEEKFKGIVWEKVLGKVSGNFEGTAKERCCEETAKGRCYEGTPLEPVKESYFEGTVKESNFFDKKAREMLNTVRTTLQQVRCRLSDVEVYVGLLMMIVVGRILPNQSPKHNKTKSRAFNLLCWTRNYQDHFIKWWKRRRQIKVVPFLRMSY